MVLKKCSACDNEHHGPWGPTRCLFVKAAKDKCLELGLPEEDFRLNLDYSNMEAMDSGEHHDPDIKCAGITPLVPPRPPPPPPKIPPSIDQDLIEDLVQVNIQQRANIDLLVNKLMICL